MANEGRGTGRLTKIPRGVRIAMVAVALVTLAGCGPILIDAQTGAANSSATFQVVPTTMTLNGQTVDAIDAQYQWCAQVKYTNLPTTTSSSTTTPLGSLPRAITSWVLQPAILVVDANGKDAWLPYGAYGPQDPGAVYTESPNRTSGGVDHIVIPVNTFTPPLTITAWCTSNVVASNYPTATWTFSATCVTSDRTCPLTKDGTFHFSG